MTRAIIGLGSNLDPEWNISEAKKKIASQFLPIAETPLERTAPIGFSEQPDFLNGAVLIETECSLPELRDRLHQIEDELGRVRTENRCGPRTIDLDVLVWDGTVVDPDVEEREFLRRMVGELLAGGSPPQQP